MLRRHLEFEQHERRKMCFLASACSEAGYALKMTEMDMCSVFICRLKREKVIIQ